MKLTPEICREEGHLIQEKQKHWEEAFFVAFDVETFFEGSKQGSKSEVIKLNIKWRGTGVTSFIQLVFQKARSFNVTKISIYRCKTIYLFRDSRKQNDSQ